MKTYPQSLELPTFIVWPHSVALFRLPTPPFAGLLPHLSQAALVQLHQPLKEAQFP